MTDKSPETTVPLIERWFPVGAVDQACATPVGSGLNEKAIFTWFASRPIAQARAAIITSLIKFEGEDPDTTLLGEINEAIIGGQPSTIAKLTDEMSASGDIPVLLDCFSGRGIILLEAARFGLRAIGTDWSPVAVLASKLLAEWPLCDWSEEPSLPFSSEVEDQPSLFRTATQEPRLVRDLRYLFSEIDERVKQAMSPHYPPNPDGSLPWGYLWATTIPCDGCKRRFPLLGSLVLRNPYRSTGDPGQALHLAVDRERGIWSVSVHDGLPTGVATYSAAEGRKGKSARCPFCSHIHPLDAVKAKGFSGEYVDEPLIAGELAAVTITDPRGRTRTVERKSFRTLRPEEVTAATRIDLDKQAPFGNMPAAPIELVAPGNADSVRGTGYGRSRWVDLMNQRQVLSFIETVRAIRACYREMKAAGLSDSYATALSSYACANLTRRLRYSTKGARLQGRGQADGSLQNRNYVGDIFTNESAVSFAFDWFEAGPGTGPGTWSSLSSTTLTPLVTHIRGLSPRARPARFRRASATSLPYRDGTIDAIVTDPPYYSMIDYADVSDLFYVWIRRCLFDIVPDLFGEPGDALGLQDKSEEIIVKRSPVGTDHRTTDWYETQLAAAFREMRRVLKPSGILTVVFGHSDPEAWRRLLGALRDAGFVVTGAWPARTEYVNTGVASIKVTVTIGCRTAPEGRWTVTAAQAEREIAEFVQRRVPKWDEWGLALSDQLMASYGPSMQVVGRYHAIQRPDGIEPELDHFLAVGRRAVADAHAFKIDELPLDTFDAHTRFAIFWLRAFGRTAVAKGEAVFQAQSSELRINDLRPRILTETKGGFTLSLAPPASVSDRSSVIEIVRAMAGTWDAGGTEATAHVLTQSGRPPDDAHLWATLAELVRQLPESDHLALALTACQRNRRAIEMATRQAASSTIHQDELAFDQAET